MQAIGRWARQVWASLDKWVSYLDFWIAIAALEKTSQSPITGRGSLALRIGRISRNFPAPSFDKSPDFEFARFQKNAVH